MAFNALNSAAPMNMPDFEDASPPHFEPDGTARHGAVGVFAALQNAKEIFEGRWTGRAYEVVKKGETRRYTIHRPPEEWPTRFVRPPGIHVRFDHIVVDGEPAPGVVAVTTLWVLNNYSALVRLGTNAYFYVPKIQTPKEAIVIERLLERLEALTGVQPGTFKIKVLYEEGNAGRYLPAIAWVLRRRLLGTNVGRWDYLGSLIEMWKDEASGIYPDPQSIGMASPNMIAYQRYNALVMLMAGMKNGELTHAAPIGGMAAVMIYPAGDPYGRSRYNPLALRAMAIRQAARTAARTDPGSRHALRRVSSELGRESGAGLRGRRQRAAACVARRAAGLDRRADPDGGGQGNVRADGGERTRRGRTRRSAVARRAGRERPHHALGAGR
jgi:malate synthase